MFATILALGLEALTAIDACTASQLVADAMDLAPGVRADLLRTARRESSCLPVGAHPGDLWAAPIMHANAKRAGILQDWCPWHADALANEHGVRGGHGMSYAYTLQYLPEWARCIPPQALDVPLVSAYLAALRFEGLCEQRGACSSRARRVYWAGVARWRERQKAEATERDYRDPSEEDREKYKQAALRRIEESRRDGHG